MGAKRDIIKKVVVRKGVNLVPGILRKSDIGPPTLHSTAMKTRMSRRDLIDYIQQVGGVDRELSKKMSDVIFDAVTIHLVMQGEKIVDPITKLSFPPEARSVEYRQRPNRPDGDRMTFEDYMRDPEVGWGDYTSKNAMASFWLMELDRPAYLAGLYLADKEADLQGAAPKSNIRSVITDEFFFRHGVLTTTHLTHPTRDIRWQATILNYVRKLQTKLHRGNKSREELGKDV